MSAIPRKVGSSKSTHPNPIFRVLAVRRDDTKCEHLVLTKYRDDDGNDGVLFVSWHQNEEMWLIQTDFFKMHESYINSFLRDYSTVSAQDYVDRFEV